MKITNIVFPWQLGDAFTIPWFGGALIAYKLRAMLTSSQWSFLRIHENVHVGQIKRMGALRYILLVVVYARLRWGLYAVCSPWEQEAYKAAGQTSVIAKCK